MSDPAPNAAQAAYWNEQAGPTWAELQAPLDRQLAPLGGRAIEALAPRPGERILDIGCGAGAASVELARAVGASGSVLGIDLSRPLLDVARKRAEGLANVRFEEADAQAYPFEPAGFDAAFSRFGVMFFSDPAAAFANIRRALKPGGRLAFVCWREPALNPVMTLAMTAALAHIEPPPPPQPGAPGPFAFADPDHVRAILEAGGFADVSLASFETKIGSGDLETTVGLSLRVGPLGGLLREHPDKRGAVIDAVRDAYRAHEGPDGVKLDSATWIVTARTPG